MNQSRALGAAVSLALLGGCTAMGGESSAAVGETASALLGENALTPNALNPNALNPNALNPNALDPSALRPNALDPGALSPSALDAVTDPTGAGALSRAFLRYAVECALTPEQAFSFTWVGADGAVHEEGYRGHLGLAPSWAEGPLDEPGERMVSACVAARTNWYGVPVTISLRSAVAPLSAPQAAELAAYAKVEGAFWGDLFAPAPYLRACHEDANAENSRAYHRDCANGHLDGEGGVVPCGLIEIAGSCDAVCGALDAAGQLYPACSDGPADATRYVVTTALPAAGDALALADLTVQVAAPPSVTTGACTTLPYTITVRNEGAATASGPLISDALPQGVALVGASSTSGGCSFTAGVLACSPGDLPPGGSVTIAVTTAPVVASGVVSNVAVVATATPESSTDDDAATVSTTLVAPAPDPWATASADFDVAPIPAGRTIWLTSVIDVAGLPDAPTTVWILGSRVTLSAGAIHYDVPVPRGRVTFDPAASVASTTYDAALDEWVTIAPRAAAAKKVFVTGVAFSPPADLPGGVEATWTAHLVASAAGLTVKRRFGAAVYTSFSHSYGLLDVHAVEGRGYGSGVKDDAGTPEAFKAFVTAGARGAGTSYVGTRSHPATGSPAQETCP